MVPAVETGPPWKTVRERATRPSARGKKETRAPGGVGWGLEGDQGWMLRGSRENKSRGEAGAASEPMDGGEGRPWMW